MDTKSPQYKHLPLLTAIYVTLAQVSYVLAYEMISFKSFLLPTGILVFLLDFCIQSVYCSRSLRV